MTIKIDGAAAGESFFALNGAATPFDAIAYDDPDMMQRLIAQGANPNRKDEAGVPLLHEAVPNTARRGWSRRF